MIKLSADEQSRLYELTYLLPADSTEAELAQEAEKIQGLISKYKGKILQTQGWGKKDLAYKIRHRGQFYTEAVYTHQVVQFPPAKINDFEKELLLEETVMRHLLVVSDNQDPAKIELPEEVAAETEPEPEKKKQQKQTRQQRRPLTRLKSKV